MGEKSREGNREPRLYESHPMLVRRESDGLEGLVKTGDISIGGCTFESLQPLDSKTKLEILLHLDGRVMNIRGEVVRSETNEEKGYTVAVRFIGMEARTRKMLASLMELEGLVKKVHPERGCMAAA